MNIPPLISIAVMPVLGAYLADDVISICILSALVSGLSGIAALLRTESNFTLGRTLVVLLNSALLGLGLSLVWWGSFSENPNVLVGLCVLIGLGGQPVLEMILGALRNGALSILFKDGSLKIGNDKKEKDDERS